MNNKELAREARTIAQALAGKPMPTVNGQHLSDLLTRLAAALDGAPAAPQQQAARSYAGPDTVGPLSDSVLRMAEKICAHGEPQRQNYGDAFSYLDNHQKWELAVSLTGLISTLPTVPAPAAPDTAGLVPAEMLALTQKANKMVNDCATMDARELGAVVLAQWFFENWPKFSSFIDGLAALQSPPTAPEPGAASDGVCCVDVGKEECGYPDCPGPKRKAAPSQPGLIERAEKRIALWEQPDSRGSNFTDDDADLLRDLIAALPAPTPAQDAGLSDNRYPGCVLEACDFESYCRQLGYCRRPARVAQKDMLPFRATQQGKKK